MKRTLGFLFVALGYAALALPVLASAATVTISTLLPANGNVFVNDRITFGVVVSGFAPQTYQVTDSYRGSSVSLSNMSGAGNFLWVPLVSDVGLHTLTIVASNSDGNSVTVSQVITVLPPPSLNITSVLPGTRVMPGTTVSFNLNPVGLTNPRYSISDSFGGSSAVTATIDASGIFTWTPDIGQNGDHTIYVYVSDSLGHNASAQQLIRVGKGPTLNIVLLSPGATVPLGTTTTFRVSPDNFAPTSFSVSDSFPGSTVSNSNVNTLGEFTWWPQASDVGTHTLTVQGTVGSYGDSATTSLNLVVTGAHTVVPVTVVAPVVTAPTPAANPPAQNSYVFSNFMGPGEDTSDGPDVLELQKLLVTLGFLKATPSGYFGNATQLAVKKFQKAHGVPATGYVGSLTRAALNKGH